MTTKTCTNKCDEHLWRLRFVNVRFVVHVSSITTKHTLEQENLVEGEEDTDTFVRLL
jgi:hypothetical protein